MYSQMIIVKPCSFISYNNIISEDIDLKREIVEEYQQVLDSVKDYI